MVGKKRRLSPPSRMEILLEWKEVEVPMTTFHLLGVGKENQDPLFKSSLMAESFNNFPCSLNLTSVVRIILPYLP